MYNIMCKFTYYTAVCELAYDIVLGNSCQHVDPITVKNILYKTTFENRSQTTICVPGSLHNSQGGLYDECQKRDGVPYH